MTQNKNITNASWIIGCKILQAVLAVIISMLTARYLGPSRFGVINYAAAIVNFITPIAQLGLGHIIVQEFVYNPQSEGDILGTSIVLSLVSSIFCICGIVVFSIFTNTTDMETIIVCGLYSLLLISQSIELVQYWFQAKLMSKYHSLIAVIVYVVISVYKAILLITRMGVAWFAVSNAIDHLIIGVLLLIIYRNKSPYKLKFSKVWAKELLHKSKYFIISSMMVTVFAQTDKIMLKLMINDSATGIYSAAVSCAGMTSFIFAAIIDSLRPTILEFKKKSNQSYEYNICRLYTLIIYFALVQSIVMTLFSKVIISILYGKDFLNSVNILRIIVWYTTFSYIGSVRNIWILAEGKQKYLTGINLAGAMANVALNFCLIPLWGVIGAAIASLVTQFFTNVIIGFIFEPIRRNNYLMMKSLNPKIVIEIINTLIKRTKSIGRKA